MSETVLLYKCDSCKRVLLKPEDGLVIHGNIYVADPANRGGLVGNNFPTEKIDPGNPEEFHPKLEDFVKETVLCVPCFLKACLPNHNLSTTRF